MVILEQINFFKTASVLISNAVNINRYDPQEQKLFGILCDFKVIKRHWEQTSENNRPAALGNSRATFNFNSSNSQPPCPYPLHLSEKFKK